MIWQDLVIMLAQIGLAASLVPTIRNRHKPARTTCVLEVIFLLGIMISFLTLGLWFSTATTFLCILAWFILLVQKRR